jgi:outer membrane protein assembly factor BamA
LFGIPLGPLPLTFSFGFPLREGSGDDKQVFGFDIGF